MSVPVIVVTGAIASGKTTVASALAAGGGALLDCDALARRALSLERVKRRLVAAFGRGVLTRAGNVSAARLGEVAFSSEERLACLNGIVRAAVTRIIEEAVRSARRSHPYIVLDAVLYFQYTFSFEADLVVVTEAPRPVRVRRLVRRDGIPRSEALRMMERQRSLEAGWRSADRRIRTDRPRRAVMRTARAIRDEFLAGSDAGRGR
jgi:dephospho-CoA kinase